jgi:hypothetical protein
VGRQVGAFGGVQERMAAKDLLNLQVVDLGLD